jgi:hypothetical protein
MYLKKWGVDVDPQADAKLGARVVSAGALMPGFLQTGAGALADQVGADRAGTDIDPPVGTPPRCDVAVWSSRAAGVFGSVPCMRGVGEFWPSRSWPTGQLESSIPL